MIRWETLTFPAAGMGEENPLADIGNIEYIHAGYETTENISEEEKARIGHGMIHTILPYTVQDNFNRDRRPRAFRAAVLENEFLRATFLPELGGRLWSLYDKEHEKELLYVNPVFQPANLAIRCAWFSGGIEFNVGIKGHNPLTCDPLFCRIARTSDGEEVLQLYEYERVRGTAFGISAYLPNGSRVLYLKNSIENLSDSEAWTYWWSNIAVPEVESTRVIVPASRSFLSTYDDGHYVLDKVDIPYARGMDATRPMTLRRSLDFFYEIPRESTERWIAAVDESGVGLCQCSTKEMLGRKLFVWGMGQGGRNWGNFLSEGKGGYIEIQAGLAYTQLEHLPLPAGETVTFTEAYTALSCDPARVQAEDYAAAQAEAGRCLHEILGEDDLHTALSAAVPTEFVSYEVLQYGSGFGALEEAALSRRVSRLYDFYPASMGEKQAPWLSLLEKGGLPAVAPASRPISYVRGAHWLALLEGARERDFYTEYQTGVVAYAMGDRARAKAAFLSSVAACENPWAIRDLAMLAMQEKDYSAAADGMMRAVSLCPDCPNLYVDAMRALLAAARYADMERFYTAAPRAVRARGRMGLLLALSYLRTGQYEKAREIINPSFCMDDMREGEISLSHLWFDLYRAILREKYPEKSEEEIAALQGKEYPLPPHLDFRMHDESEHD